MVTDFHNLYTLKTPLPIIVVNTLTCMSGCTAWQAVQIKLKEKKKSNLVGWETQTKNMMRKLLGKTLTAFPRPPNSKTLHRQKDIYRH